MKATPFVLLAAVIVAAAPITAAAQSLAQRVDAVRDGSVAFSFPVRAGVCGNGRSFISLGGSTYIGNVTISGGTTGPNERECVAGPARVLVTRAGGIVTDVGTVVGPPVELPTGVTDLGSVPAREAAQYLLGIAARADGKPGRDAIMPAALAEGADVSSELLTIARDRSRPNETRRSAMTWLGRGAGAPDEQLVDAYIAIARDRADHTNVREHALSSLARLDRGQGMPALIALTRGDDRWLAAKAATSISRSGDPRAREFLRTVIRQAEAAPEIREIAIRGLAGSYATAEDAALLRASYARIESESARQRLISSLAGMGGRENVQWLLALAADRDQPIALRRRAVRHASDAEVPVAEAIALYDRAGEREVKQEIIDQLSRRSEPAAADKLLSIARTEQDQSLRRRAVSRLSNSKDPRVVEALQGIASGTRN